MGRYALNISVSGGLFNYGIDAATGIWIKMMWYNASDIQVYQTIMVVEDVPGGESQAVSATYAYVGLIDHWSYTIHWDQGERSSLPN